MLYEIIGLIAEILFLIAGIYIYLFSIGRVKVKNPANREKAEQFRLENHWWLRLLSLALIAMMSVNIFLHLKQMMS